MTIHMARNSITPFIHTGHALAAILTAFLMASFSSPSLAQVPGFQLGAPSNAPPDGRMFVRRWQSNPPLGFPTLSPKNLKATKAAYQRYKSIAKKGGWILIPKGKLSTGSSGQAVALLRERLRLTGDLKGKSWNPDLFDYYLEKAVMRFQARHGLAPTGVVDKRTRAALNVSAKIRARQLGLGLRRLKKYTGKTRKGRYVVVNIPSAQIEAVDRDKVISRHAGVVGKLERKTPILSSWIHTLNFNPIWRLPPTVINKDLIPKGRRLHAKGQSVLVNYGIDAYDGNGRKMNPTKIKWNTSQPYSLSYRQQPGKDNPMGFLKINFHNAHSVYMHDTPSETIFGRSFRAASSGCIRVSNIEKLATWLLNGQKGWDAARVQQIKKSGKRKDVQLKKRTRLHFVYITAWATPDGIVQFRRDLYRKDGVGKEAANY